MTASPRSDSSEARTAMGMNQLKLEVEVARDELAATLDALEDRLNVSAKLKRTWLAVKKQYRYDPVPVIVTAALSVVAVAGVVSYIAKGRHG